MQRQLLDEFRVTGGSPTIWGYLCVINTLTPEIEVDWTYRYMSRIGRLTIKRKLASSGCIQGDASSPDVCRGTSSRLFQHLRG